jgi:hypothetical protein
MAQSKGALQHGDRAAREVSERIGGTVATTAELAALPLKMLRDGQFWLNQATGQAYVYKSTSVAAEGGIACTAGGRFLAVGVGRRTITVGEADLTTATNGTAQTINVGPALPTGARVVGCDVTLATQLTGGSATAVTLSVGISGAATALINAFDALGSTAGASYAAGASAATRPRGSYSAAQIIATFTPDSGHALSGLTAGSVTIDIDYVVS